MKLESDLNATGICAEHRICTTPGSISQFSFSLVHFWVNSVFLSVVNDIKCIVDTSIDSYLTDLYLLGKLCRQGIADGYVLKTKVSHIYKVLGLWVEVSATVLKNGNCSFGRTSLGKPWICCILVNDTFLSVFICDVGSLALVESVRATHKRHNESGLSPHRSLAYTLEVQIEIKSFPVTADSKAVLVTWLGVTNHNQVTVIVNRALSSVDLIVTILVHELDVTWAVDELACLELNLTCDTFGRNIVALLVFAYEIRSFEIPVGLKSPNVTVTFS